MKRFLSAFFCAFFLTSQVLAHTNSIGYVGDGQGGLNFYYGTYHYTNFNEAEIKITDSAGNSSIDAFDILTSTSPAGLISGVNYFTTDGTQLVPYTNSTAAGGQSNTWQGINYTNLSAGSYTFLYIPLGDAESSFPNGNPTADWAPWDEVIRSLTINLTTGDLTGDANNNGILDILEVAEGAASNPTPAATVTSQGSSQVIAYTAATAAGVQTVTGTQTDTTWDNMSDGTTQNTQSTVTNLGPATGRVDQYAIMDEVSDFANRSLLFDPFRKDGIQSEYGKFYLNSNYAKMKMANEYEGKSSGFGLTGLIDIPDEDAKLIVGFNAMKNEVEGILSDSEIAKKQATIGIQTGNEDVLMIVTANYSRNDYTSERGLSLSSSIPFSGSIINQSESKGEDKWLSGRAYINIPDEKMIVPFIGGAMGQSTRDAYVETGDVRTARTVAEVQKTIKYAEAGVRLMHKEDQVDLYGQVGITTDKWMTAEAGATYNIDENLSVSLSGSKIKHEDTDINKVMLTGSVKF